MSVPTEADFALIKIGDGATPTEVFTIACGIQDVQINRVANSEDRYVRDCAKPGEVPIRKKKVTGKSLTITGGGMTDKAQVEVFEEALGVIGNYKVELYQDDGTDTGELMGTFAGPFLMDSSGMNVPREGNSTAEITLSNHGAWTWTAAT